MTQMERRWLQFTLELSAPPRAVTVFSSHLHDLRTWIGRRSR
jgi:hypothetical protein